MSVWALGLNHTTAPLDLRGRFAFAVEQMGPVLEGFRQSIGGQTEATILSTFAAAAAVLTTSSSSSAAAAARGAFAVAAGGGRSCGDGGWHCCRCA